MGSVRSFHAPQPPEEDVTMSIETVAPTVKLFIPKFGEVRDINATDEQFYRINYQALSPAEHAQFVKEQAQREAEHAAHAAKEAAAKTAAEKAAAEKADAKNGRPFQTRADKDAEAKAADTPAAS
jgi:nitrogen regulatory protein PII-like uncharacterized protein